MKKLIMGLIVILLLLLSISCVGAPEKAPAPQPAPPAAVPRGAMPAPIPTPAQVSVDKGQPGEADRMVVRSGQISMVVDDIPAAMDHITQLAERYKGYIVSSRSGREGDRLRGSITIRVSVGDFDNVMRSLREFAVEVMSQSSSSKDVTEEYVDLGAKIKNLQAAEEQLLKIMARAEKVEDILSIQRELARTRGEIELAKGRMQFLERTSATSIIEVRLEQARLTAKFTANTVRVSVGEEVFLSSQVAGGFAPYSFEWDFGDGNTNIGESTPTHVYRYPGSYTVSLKVTDDRGNTHIETRKGYITILTGPKVSDIFTSAWLGLKTLGEVLVAVLIWVIVFSPVWIVGGGIFYWVRRRKKKET